MTIYLERYDPQINMARYYRLIVARTLFGEWALIAEWGRIGSPGRVRENRFSSPQEVEAALTAKTDEKVRRGYKTCHVNKTFD